jgi:hypothetical protein
LKQFAGQVIASRTIGKRRSLLLKLRATHRYVF